MNMYRELQCELYVRISRILLILLNVKPRIVKN